MSIQIELPARYGHTEEELAFIREMGVHFLNLNVMPDKANLRDMETEVERLSRYDLSISDLACPPLQKNGDIILARENRDGEIQKFCDLVRLAGKLRIPLVSVAWQPNGILRSGRCPCPHTRGGTAFYAQQEDIESKGDLHGRSYSPEEIWDSFAYFLKQVIPVCEDSGVRLALHPNDPPLPTLGGVASLIYTSDDYRRAIELADSPALGVKLCIGCWLENPAFGNLERDIRDFQRKGRLVEVHFRNVSSPLPYFEETLSEDGYADMYGIMRTLVESGFEGFLSVDHAFRGYPATGGELGSLAYPTGHTKGLLHAVEYELGLR
jgi:mannonate dehydratase